MIFICIIMANKIYMLIKVFEKEEYADKFLNNGEMYCQLLSSFKKIEDGYIRGDKHEGVIGWHQPENVKITFGIVDELDKKSEFTINPEEVIGPITINDSLVDSQNIYCMYSFVIDDEISFSYDENNLEEKIAAKNKLTDYFNEKIIKIADAASFGDYAVVIYDVKKFIDKVDSYAKKNTRRYNRGLVQYFDPLKFNGFFSAKDAPFRKSNIYSSQSEYRFSFYFESEPTAKNIKIGSLKKIAQKIRITHVPKMVSFKISNA